jgi:hypothetical protein
MDLAHWIDHSPDTCRGVERLCPGSCQQEGSRKHKNSTDSSSDFVFAYRLSKITYARKSFFKRGSVPKEKPYQTGAAIGEGGSATDEVSYALGLDDLNSLGIQDLTAQMVDNDAEVVDNDFDDEEMQCILPERESTEFL